MSATQVVLMKLPRCSFCRETAKFDFRSLTDQWAYGCQHHYEEYRAFAELGYGKGQELIAKDLNTR